MSQAENSDEYSILALVQRMSDKLDKTVTDINQSVDQSLSSFDQRVDSKLQESISLINQSVDSKLQGALADIQQRMDEELAAAQSRWTSAAGGKGKGKAPPTPASDPESGASNLGQSNPGTQSRSWADRMEEEDDTLDLTVPSDEELEPCRAKRPKLVEVSEETKEVVRAAFTSTLSNTARREIRGRAPGLDLTETRCPRLDSLYKTSESKFSSSTEAKQIDSDLQRVQALILDVCSPLLELKSIVEENVEAVERDPKEIVNDAIRLLGNAVGQTSKIRRKRVLKSCNPNIQDLADEESLFTGALPNLFGSEFERKMKDRAESVKILSRSQTPSSQSGSRVFRGGHHSHAQRGGGPPFRGGRDHYPMGTFRNPFVYRGGNRRGSYRKKSSNPKQ